jgi:uncharacterized protein
MKLSEQEGVNSKVVQLFSVFHDSQRWNEHEDPAHGARGAQLALHLREHLPLTDEEFEMLTVACGLHTSSRTHDNITIAAAFDSDRLDLWRVGTTIDPNYLCTPLAKRPETIEWALRKNMDSAKMLPENAFGIEGYGGEIE